MHEMRVRAKLMVNVHTTDGNNVMFENMAPRRELTVKDLDPSYQLQIIGLMPASVIKTLYTKDRHYHYLIKDHPRTFTRHVISGLEHGMDTILPESNCSMLHSKPPIDDGCVDLKCGMIWGALAMLLSHSRIGDLRLWFSDAQCNTFTYAMLMSELQEHLIRKYRVFSGWKSLSLVMRFDVLVNSICGYHVLVKRRYRCIPYVRWGLAAYLLDYVRYEDPALPSMRMMQHTPGAQPTLTLLSPDPPNGSMSEVYDLTMAKMITQETQGLFVNLPHAGLYDDYDELFRKNQRFRRARELADKYDSYYHEWLYTGQMPYIEDLSLPTPRAFTLTCNCFPGANARLKKKYFCKLYAEKVHRLKRRKALKIAIAKKARQTDGASYFIPDPSFQWPADTNFSPGPPLQWQADPPFNPAPSFQWPADPQFNPGPCFQSPADPQFNPGPPLQWPAVPNFNPGPSFQGSADPQYQHNTMWGPTPNHAWFG